MDTTRVSEYSHGGGRQNPGGGVVRVGEEDGLLGSGRYQELLVGVLSLVRWEDSDADVFILSRFEEFMPEKEGKLLRSSQYSTSNKVVQVNQVLSKQKFLP